MWCRCVCVNLPPCEDGCAVVEAEGRQGAARGEEQRGAAAEWCQCGRGRVRVHTGLSTLQQQRGTCQKIVDKVFEHF